VVIRSASDAIVIADSRGDIVTWNPAAERIFGYSEAEAVGESLTLFIPERFREAHHEGLSRVVATGETRIIGETVEVFGVRKDGTEFPVELSLAFWDRDGERFFTGIIRDVSERTRLVAALTESQGRTEAIFQSANDAIITIDGEGRVLQWNPHAEELFGYPESEMLGQPLDVIIPERFRDLHRVGVERVAGGGETRVIGHTAELAAVHRDGREFPIELSLGSWESDGERFFSGIVRDISERTSLMSALTESQARLEAILDSANDAIITIDAEGRVLQWNPHAEGLFGYPAAEMVGQHLDAIIPERFRDAHHGGVRRVAGGGETRVIGHTAELAAVHRDGHEIPIELSLGTWESDGERFFSGIVRDITERKQAEEDIRLASESLAEKNEMLEGLSTKLAKYLSRQVYDSIFEGRTEVRVESYRKKLTVFFSDIQGFTELTDRMEAEPLSQLLNHYLSEMSDIAQEHGGTVDKFIGDGIMIFFGDPDSQGEREDAIACARMAVEMRERVDELKDDWQRQAGSVPLHVRIGINTGYCTVGNFGSQDRLDYTVVGKEVNTASRLEEAAQPDQILISHDTYELIKDELRCDPIGEKKLKGLAYPIRTYEVVRPAIDGYQRPTAETADGFSLELDPSRLAPEQAAAAREALQRALGALEAVPATESSDEGA
jgi:PAS domain S-box-containing protein